MLSLNTNLEALKAGQALQTATARYTQAAERISTGLRVNSAKDDPSALGMANRLKAQLGGFSKAIENINHGIAMVQTVDNALTNIVSTLTSMRDLAVSSASATVTSTQLDINQAQFSAMIDEIDQIAGSASYNGKNLLDGSTTSVVLQAGAQGDSVLGLSFSSAASQSIGEGAPLSLTSRGGLISTPTPLASGDLLINGTNVGASLAADDLLSTAFNSSSAIAKAAAINRASSSANGFVIAAPLSTTVSGKLMTPSRNVSGTVTLNGKQIDITLLESNSASENRSVIVSQINAETPTTGVMATDTGDAVRGVTLSASDGRNITLSYSVITDSDTGLAAAGTYIGSYSLRSSTGDSLTLSHSAGKNIDHAGLSDGAYTAHQAVFTSATRDSLQGSAPTTLASADLMINGFAIRAPQNSDDAYSYATASSTRASSAIALAQAINASSDLTNVQAHAQANVVEGNSITPGNLDTLYLNAIPIDVSDVMADLTDPEFVRNKLVSLINAKQGLTKITASNNGSGLTLTAADGRNISIAVEYLGSGVNSARIGLGGAMSFTAAAGDERTFFSTVKLSSDRVFTVTPGTAGKTGFEEQGFREGTYGGAPNAIKVATLDISTAAGADVALNVIDEAIDMISSYQSRAGAQLNRLDYRQQYLESQKLTTTQAVSNIMDANYAEETANLASASILQNAATAILAQANVNQDIVKYLLKMN